MAAKRSFESLEENVTHPACSESKQVFTNKNTLKILNRGQGRVEGSKDVSESCKVTDSETRNHPRNTTQIPYFKEQPQEATKMSQAGEVQAVTMATAQPGQMVQGSKPFDDSKEKRQRKRIQGGWASSGQPRGGGPPRGGGARGRGSRGQGTRGQGTRGQGIRGPGTRGPEVEGRGGIRFEGNVPSQNLPHPNAYPAWQQYDGSQQANYGYASQNQEGYDQPGYGGAGFKRNGLGQPGDVSYSFRYQETERTTRREEVMEKEIHEDGKHQLSLGPSGESAIKFCKHFIEEGESQRMFEKLVEEINWNRRLIQKPDGESYYEPRKTHWFGEHPYSYSRVTLESCKEWHPVVRELKEAIELNTGETYNSVLCNLYEDGHDGVQWHSDDEFSLGVNPVIASLSLGATRRFQMRKKPSPDATDRDDYSKSEKYLMHLNSGSLLVMMGSTQADWQHRVPKEYHDRTGRINLTFRTIHPDERNFRQGYQQQ